MTTWEVLAVAATTTATVAVATQLLPIWIVAAIWLIGWLISVLNTEKISYRTMTTYLTSGAILAATGTNFIIGKFFTGSEYSIELSIGIAFTIWLLAHLVIIKILARKEQIVDTVIQTAQDSAVGKIKKALSDNKTK